MTSSNGKMGESPLIELSLNYPAFIGVFNDFDRLK